MITDFKKKIAFIAVFGVIVLTARYFGISCIWLYLFGIECPGCGMTRACISALGLNFQKAFSYHPMFWSVPALLLYFFFDGRVFGKIADRIILILIAVGFGINWLVKLI